MENLRQRISEIPKSIQCPEWYGKYQRDQDRKFVADLESKREKKPLTESEDNEKARAQARLDAFAYQQSQTPEGRASSRKLALSIKRFRGVLTAEEKVELERLRELFPDEP